MKLFTSSLLVVSSTLLTTYNANAQEIERIEVSSSRYQHELLTADNVLIHPDDLAASPNSLANWLTATPGVSLNGQGGQFQSYSIRGFSKARIKTQVNGVPILTDRRAGNSVAFIPSSFIESVDIRKGPSAAYYGSDAMGGVISAELKHTDGVEMLMGYQGQNNRKEAGVLYGNDVLSGAFSYQQANDSTAPNGQRLNSSFEQLSGLLSSQLLNEHYSLTATLLISQGRDIAKSSAQFPDERITLYPFDDHILAEFSFEHQRWGQFSVGFHDQNWQSDIIRVENRQNITEYQSQTVNALWQQTFSGFLGLTQSNTLGGKWGLEWIKRSNVEIDEQELTLENDIVFQHAMVDAEQDNLALFVHQYGQWQDWDWSLGARIDYLEQTQYLTKPSSVSENYTSLTSSIAKSITPHFRVEAEFGNSFRFATLSERFFDGETPRGQTLGNPNLKPEESVGAQIRANYQLSARVSFDVSSYLYEVDNYIERYQYSEQILSYRNTQSATIYGAELIANIQQNGDVSHHISYQYNRGENKTSQPLDDINPDTLQWQTQAVWANWQVNNQLIYRFNKHKVGSNEQALDEAFIWHLNAYWQMNQQWRLGVYLNNLTNELYRSTADEDAPWQSERSVSLTIKYQR